MVAISPCALNSMGPKTKYTYESISLMGWWCYTLHVYTTNMPSYRTHAYTFIHNLTRTRMYVHVQVSERLEAPIGYHVPYLHYFVPRLTRVSVKQHSPPPRLPRSPTGDWPRLSEWWTQLSRDYTLTGASAIIHGHWRWGGVQGPTPSRRKASRACNRPLH